MTKYNLLNNLLPHIDDAFKAFYDSMLGTSRLSVFFDSDEQIQQLIIKQKKHFTASLEMDKETLKKDYIRLGEYHYDLRIPYVDFIKGTEILEEHFVLNTQKYACSTELLNEIFDYFKVMKAFTAKGYLNKMIVEDVQDIESFFEQTNLNDNTYLPKTLVLEKIQWLKTLLHDIQNGKDFQMDDSEGVLTECLDELKFITKEKREFFESLERRIMLNTHNLFYFLKKEEYLEILPLYTSLLSIYKLTLMINNAVTIEYASKIIEDMQLDAETKLFRKDLFKEILKKEMALTKRDSKYVIAVAYIDLDDFKKINDNYGHYTGDKVIEKIGQVIRKNIRVSDFGFRIGGDEFALILKNANMQQALNVCKKIKIEFSSYIFDFNEDVNFHVSTSIGLSEYSHEKDDDIELLIQNVDKKLYEAKNAGKNQIIV